MTLLLCPSAEEDANDPEPFLGLEEELEEAPASSESASAQGTFRMKEKGHEGSRGGAAYQWQQAEAQARQTPHPARGGGTRARWTRGVWAGRNLRPSAAGRGRQEREPEACREAEREVEGILFLEWEDYKNNRPESRAGHQKGLPVKGVHR